MFVITDNSFAINYGIQVPTSVAVENPKGEEPGKWFLFITAGTLAAAGLGHLKTSVLDGFYLAITFQSSAIFCLSSLFLCDPA